MKGWNLCIHGQAAGAVAQDSMVVIPLYSGMTLYEQLLQQKLCDMKLKCLCTCVLYMQHIKTVITSI